MRQHPDGCAVNTDGREGTVVATDGEHATIMVEADAACGQGANCAHCSLFRPDAHTIQVRRGGLEEGDRVRLVVSARSAYRSIALIFLVPMALAIAGLLVGSGVAGDFGGLVGGVGGFTLAVIIALQVNRRLAGASDLEVELLDRPTTEG
jgi:positive regulator of sigma E activity